MWTVLHEHGAGWRKEEGTKRYWKTLSEEQQAHAYTTITKKLADGLFVHYDPIQAIKETLWSLAETKDADPTNYQGRALPAGKTVVSAKYNGAWGFYTLEDAEAHNMPIRYPDHIFTTDRRAYELVNNHIDYVQVFVPYMADRIVLCTRANALKYHLKILADPRNPIFNS